MWLTAGNASLSAAAPEHRPGVPQGGLAGRRAYEGLLSRLGGGVQAGAADKAQAMMESALEGLEAALGAGAREVGEAAVDLGALHLDHDRLEAGLPLMRRALAIQTALLGPDHPDVVAIREVVEC